jgi:hypothetical protein
VDVVALALRNIPRNLRAEDGLKITAQDSGVAAAKTGGRGDALAPKVPDTVAFNRIIKDVILNGAKRSEELQTSLRSE